MAQGQVNEQPTEAELVERLTNALNPGDEEADESAPAEETPQEPGQEGTAPEDQEGQQAAEVEEQAVDLDVPFVPTKYKSDNGQDVEETLSINQLRSGYMMQKDYQRKTAELSRARETLTQEVEQQVTQERQNYIQRLQEAEQALMAMVVPELNGVDFEKLAGENPAEAVRLQAKAHRLNQTVQAIRQQRTQAEQQAMQKVAEQSKRALADPISGIPGWGDKVYNELIADGSRANGFTPEEVAAVVDHRMIRVLWKAMQWDKAQTAKPKDQARPAPKVLKPGVSTGSRELQAKQEGELKARLQKSGSVDAAAELYLARMKGR